MKTSVPLSQRLPMVVLLMLCTMQFITGFGQVTVTSSGGTSTATYATLSNASGAFAAINAGIHTGTISIVITSNISTEDGTNGLNESGSGSAIYSSISMSPQNASITISGTKSTGSIINLNGADNVTIDGRIGGTGSTKDLTITNLSTSGFTLQFTNDATNNNIKYVTLQGDNAGPTSGTVMFTNTAVATGNDNNTISYCDIRDIAGTGTPSNAVYAYGNTTTTTLNNSGNTIDNCNIYNYHDNTSSAIFGVNIFTGNTGWTISNNSFYQTTNRTTFAAGAKTGAIFLNNASGNGFVVRNNYVGGTAAQCGGSAYVANSATTAAFLGILVNVGTTTPTAVYGNTIKNLSLASTTINTTSQYQTSCINLSGSVYCGLKEDGTTAAGNIIGDQSVSTVGASASIIFNSTVNNAAFAAIVDNAATNATVKIANNKIAGIYIFHASLIMYLSGIDLLGAAVSTHIIDNNEIGNNTAGTAAANMSIQNLTGRPSYGIIVNGGVTTSAITISNNKINNIYATSTGSNPGQVYGVLVLSSVATPITISSNEIRDIVYANGRAGNSADAFTTSGGISFAGYGTGNIIRNNSIYNIQGTSANSYNTCGISLQCFNSASNITMDVYGNLIYNISSSSTSALSSFISGTTGINAACSGTASPYNLTPVYNIYNNIIRLGYNRDGTDATTTTSFIGIRDTMMSTSSVAKASYYYNTIYIGGAGVGSTTGIPSYGMSIATTSTASGNTAVTRIIKNNIIVNARSNSSTGSSHYAIGIGTGAVGISGHTINNNDYVANGTGGVLGLIPNINRAALSDIQTGTAQDAASINVLPVFTNATAASPNLHITKSSVNSGIKGKGVTISGISTDYDGITRAATPGVGADEYGAGVFYAVNSTNWETGSTWDAGSAPTASDDAVVPAGISVTVGASGTTCSNLSLLTGGSTLTINNGFTNTVTGNLANSGTIVSVGTGKILMNGSAKTISGTGTIGNIELNNPGGFTITGKQSITGVLTPTAGTLNTGGLLTLKSTSITNTASVGIVGGSISGSVTVERYIPAGLRAFRFIAPAVTTSTAIKSNWQEGVNNTTTSYASNQNPNTGYGTHITGSATGSNGFDATITGNPSLYQFDNATQTWGSVSNTDVNTLTAGNAYRILIRGNRSFDLTSTATTNTATVLRATGSLVTGAVTMNSTGVGANAGMPLLASSINQYSFVGNPYASPVNWASVNAASTDLTGFYYIWDPTIASRGAYVSCFTDGTKSNGSSSITTDIQSSQSFFIRNKSSLTTGPSLVFQEAHKSLNNTNVFRNQSTNASLGLQLFLTANYPNGFSQDGATVVFNSSFDNAVNDDDAGKMVNLDENLAIQQGSSSLSIERRSLSSNADTVYLKLWQVTNNSFTLKVDAANFGAGINAFLQDSYLNTETQLNLAGASAYNFTINTAITGSNDANRFRIVFRSAGVLPLSITSIKAYQTNGNAIQVDWATQQEVNVSSYNVEKSIDGLNFNSLGTVMANNNVQNIYSFIDNNPINGSNFYRIKSLDKNGETKYSSVVNVKIGKVKNSFTVLSNPIKNGNLLLQMEAVEKGTYQLNFFNAAGQLVSTQSINHAGGSATFSFNLNSPAKGIYQLSIIGNKIKTTKTILVD